MSRWFRVDDGLVDDPKVQQLPDALFRAVINLWCVTSQNGGKLPSVDQIAFKLRMGLHKTEKILDTLRRLNLIEDDDDGTRPHNWNGRQFKSDATDPTAASRSKKYRDGKRGVTDASRVTDRDADRDAGVSVTATRDRAETEQTSEPKGSAPGDQETELFRRGKQILGANAGGVIAKLKAHHGGNIAKARATIETASTKENAREYVNRVLRGRQDDGFFAPTGAIV